MEATQEATRLLCDTYKRIFSLRNEVTSEAVDELIGMFGRTDSVLLRHEVAYALGQMQLPHAEPFLKRVLADRSEHPVTRHEAAEALGAIGSADAISTLRVYSDDAEPIVRESCAVALDMYDRGGYEDAGVVV